MEHRPLNISQSSSGNSPGDISAHPIGGSESAQAPLNASDFRLPDRNAFIPFLDPHAKLDFFHGSNSACLEQVIQEGLLPFGMMTGVPFSGTLDRGVTTEGVNQSCLSAVEARLADRAFSFAVDGLEGWNPLISRENTKFCTNQLDKAHRDLAKYLAEKVSGESDELIQRSVKRHIQENIDILDKRLEIETRRILMWETLDENQRELIRHPFPVMLGIAHEGETEPVRSQVSGERGLPSVSPQHLIIFVPEAEVERTTKLVSHLGSHIPVRSLGKLRENLSGDIPGLSRDIEGIGNRHHSIVQERLLVSDIIEERLRGIQVAKGTCLRLGHTTSIERRLSDPEPDVVQAAITALGEIGNVYTCAALRKFNPADSAQRQAVDQALNDIQRRMVGV